MARNTIIPSLSKEEQEVLALCGITQDEQLARIGPTALQRDIEAASPFFPDSLADFQAEISRLEYICEQAASTVQLTADETAALWQEGNAYSPMRRMPGAAAEAPQKRRYSAATGRMLVEDEQLGAKKAELLDEARRKRDPRDFSHAISSARPLSIYINAWFTIFLAAAAITLVLIMAGLLIGIEYKGESSVMLAAVLIFIVVAYAFMLNLATCSTCRTSVFTFRRYPRHRQAHHLPLLGHTIATALYTIFFFRYRCPSCGTPQKLFGKRSRRRRKR